MTEVKEDSKIQFFGEIDIDSRTGTIKSQYPAWFHEIHIENMQEEISRKEKFLELGYYAPDQIPRIQGEIKNEKVRLNEIKASKPDLGSHRDKIARSHESLGKQIKDSLPTRKETKLGLVSPHEELKRLNTKHISISPEIAKACGVKAVRGKISGKEAAKCYQIMGKALGENTNVERLRKDGGGESYKTIHDLTQAILEGRSIKGA